MRARPTASTAHKARKSKSDRFLWHLRPPYDRDFDHQHWWPLPGKKPDEVPIFAAAWEVLRRHPKVPRLLPEDAWFPSAFASFVGNHALRSWPQLTDQEQWDWLESLEGLPPQHGLDLRPLNCLTTQATNPRYGCHVQAILTLDQSLKQRAESDPLAKQLLASAVEAKEAAIARLAVEHDRAGRILIAIHKDVADIDSAAAAFKACLQLLRTKCRHGTERHTGWLRLIREFEQHEIGLQPKHKRDSQLFAKYRRMLSRWQWPKIPPP